MIGAKGGEKVEKGRPGGSGGQRKSRECEGCQEKQEFADATGHVAMWCDVVRCGERHEMPRTHLGIPQRHEMEHSPRRSSELGPGLSAAFERFTRGRTPVQDFVNRKPRRPTWPSRSRAWA